MPLAAVAAGSSPVVPVSTMCVMAASPKQTNARTPLAKRRVKLGMTQDDMVAATGIPRTTYKKLEKGGYLKPPVQHLTNCAIVLGCSLGDLCPREWHVFNPDSPEPDDPSIFWNVRARREERRRQQAEAMEQAAAAEFEAELGL